MPRLPILLISLATLTGCSVPAASGPCEAAAARIEECTGAPVDPMGCTDDVAGEVLSLETCEAVVDASASGKADEGCGWLGEATGWCEAPAEPPAADPWEAARDVHLAIVDVSGAGAPPEPEGFGILIEDPADERSLLLNGPEYRQRWSGGYEGFGWNSGSDHGRACTHAGVLRLQAIWSYVEDGRRPAYEVFIALEDERDFRGLMYHWVEDVSQGGTNARQAGIWGWQDLLKWTTVARADGTCELPTLDQVLALPDTCHPEYDTVAHCSVPGF